MKVAFRKYQGTGNDFILVDNREKRIAADTIKIKKLCDRHFGIGSDGLILLENDNFSDFKMVYFNSDGAQSTMCGNGGRCLVRFASDLRLIQNSTEFMAIDGLHKADIEADFIRLKMGRVDEVVEKPEALFLNTGSPHHVEFVENLKDYPVFSEGRRIRNEVYGTEGANVNFVELTGADEIFVRTYERGVEDETLSCGTGVTAAAIAANYSNKVDFSKVKVKTPGGNLSVNFDKESAHSFKNIWLQGPAEFVFEGQFVW